MGLPHVRVVKVGGSLFTLGRLPSALREWLGGQPEATNVLIAGGGELVNCIRAASDRFDLPEHRAHWLCIDLMSVTARVLHEILAGSDLLTDFDTLRNTIRSSAAQLIVYDARQFLLEVEPEFAGNHLPQNWTVTSDSIAARLAESLQAEELVLLKSANVDGITLENCAEVGITDEFFPTACKPLQAVRVVDLQSAEFPETRII